MAATYITLAECRSQVNIKDDTFTEDDAYLQILAEAAEINVQHRVGPLKDHETAHNTLDENLKLGILFLVATWYKHRENIVTGTIVSEMPYAMQDILQDYLNRGIA